ncbi:hypothetical protein DOY81_005017 [Sarcophaga bullata]|nr:hypothetical protein DOY81_005017 [Sarcophaga bullata]
MQYEMYQQQMIADSNNSNNSNKMKNATYSIKKVLKTFFKKQQNKQHYQQQTQTAQQFPSSSTETFEDLDNLRNMQAEQQLYYHEIIENSANEKLSHMVYCDETPVDAEDQEDIYVPVRFARTEAGTFFWTTNLQPVTCTIAPTVDEDLLQPAYCYSNNQYPLMQFQDRWAQA